MSRFLIAVFCGTLLGGCGSDQPTAPSAPEDGDKPVLIAADSSPAGERGRGVDVGDLLEEFKEQMVDSGRGKFRFDRIRDAKEGGRERQIYIEMLGASDKEAASLVAKAMESLGYTTGRSFGDENGIRLSYKKNGEPLTRVLVRSREAHSNLTEDDATSSVYLTQPVLQPE